MSKKYNFSEEELKPIWNRDMVAGCVYCKKPMKKYAEIKAGKGIYSDQATIEHLHHKKPFYKDKGLKLEGLAICCRSCNSSRGKLELKVWFSSNYCKDRDKPINETTVAKPVKDYLKREHKYTPLTVV